jgi:biopolymer transport protein ExbD
MCRTSFLLAGAVATLTLATACDDPPKNGAAASASAQASAAPSASAAPTATERPKPTAMPDILVDTDGPYIGGSRVKMGVPETADNLAKLVKDLPINGKAVAIRADKKAKASHVSAVVEALGAAGAPRVTIKTEGRNDLPKEIPVTPESRVTSAAPCSAVATVLKDFSTAVWAVKGGLGKKQRKGLAGPDFSHTGETLEKDLAACDSPAAFFQGDDGVGWESIFNLAGTILVSDKKKRIDTLVLLHEEPVAGRPVALGKH